MKTLPIYLVRSEVQTACLQLTLLAADPDRVEELTLPDGSSEAEMETWIEAIMDARFASAAAMMESIADDNGQLKRKTGSACRRYMNKLTFPSAHQLALRKLWIFAITTVRLPHPLLCLTSASTASAKGFCMTRAGPPWLLSRCQPALTSSSN